LEFPDRRTIENGTKTQDLAQQGMPLAHGHAPLETEVVLPLLPTPLNAPHAYVCGQKSS